MKRASVKNNEKEDKMQSRYQNLLEDYLDLQKEYVSKKKKLKCAQEKRDTLLGEVRFLRQRRKHLLKTKSICPPSALECNQVDLPNSDSKKTIVAMQKNHAANGPAFVANQKNHAANGPALRIQG